MPVAFGFSVGDFIAGIELVGTIIDTLKSSGSASKEHRELIAQLVSPENALLQVKRLDLEESQYDQVIAPRQGASQCHRTIDEFWKTVQKYQSHLSISREPRCTPWSILRHYGGICFPGYDSQPSPNLRKHQSSSQASAENPVSFDVAAALRDWIRQTRHNVSDVKIEGTFIPIKLVDMHFIRMN